MSVWIVPAASQAVSAFADRPGAVFLAADGQEADVAGFLEGPQQKRFGILEFLRVATVIGLFV